MKGDKEWCGYCSYCNEELEPDDFDPYEYPPDLCKECRFPTFVEQFPERRQFPARRQKDEEDERPPF